MFRRAINTFISAVASFTNAITPSKQQDLLYKFLKKERRKVTGPEKIILVECAEDSLYYGLLGMVVNSLNEKQELQIHQYTFSSLRVGESSSLLHFLLSQLVIIPIHRLKWTRLYKAFCSNVAYHCTSIHPIDDLSDFCLAWRTWRGCASNDSLLALEMSGVKIGDLISDSYIRFKPAPTIDIKNFYMLAIIWQACRSVRRANAYFSNTKPAIFFCSYSTYIQHGIGVRVALKNDVNVYAFGNYEELCKKLSIDDWLHTRDTTAYARDFSLMNGKEDKLLTADAGLSRRLSGGIDGATSYMAKSAYAETEHVVPDVSDATVVFLHDFYDSPHVYHEMVFSDFWLWICFTINTLNETGNKFYVKPHPNQSELSKRVMFDLLEKFPNLKVISPKVTNRQLISAGMTRAVTIYGTVAHEMAYFGIPTIACARHPHTSFDFCFTATTKKEYAYLLKNKYKSELSSDVMKEQSLIFYFMHNLNMSNEERELCDAVLNFRGSAVNRENTTLVRHIEYIRNLKAYGGHVDIWLSEINRAVK